MRRIRLARVLQQISDFLPRKYPVRSAAGLPQPFFIFGSGRNGSTLLNRMLNQHTDLFLPSEQYFLGNSIIKFKLYNFLLWRDLVKIITGELLPSTGSHTWQMSGEEVFDQLNNSHDKSLEFVFDTIYRSYGTKYKSFKTWGDSTPLNTFYLQEIFGLYPQAKYLFLLRDGRDVVDSYRRAGEEYLGELATPTNAANHWLQSIKKYDWLKTRTDVKVVRYEELVTDTEKTLSTICDFLEIDFQNQMLNHSEVGPTSEMYAEPQHKGIFKPVFSDSIGKWQAHFDASDPVFAELNTALKRFRYL